MLFPVAAVWWTSIAVLVAALVAAGVHAWRAVREVQRIQHRVEGYAVLPVVASLEKAGLDAQRIAIAVEQIDPLVARARRAVSVIRAGPIPPDVVAAVLRIGIEVQNLREFSI